jgi:hypothetical protein
LRLPLLDLYGHCVYKAILTSALPQLHFAAAHAYNSI